jgi:hypothetical protein
MGFGMSKPKLPSVPKGGKADKADKAAKAKAAKAAKADEAKAAKADKKGKGGVGHKSRYEEEGYTMVPGTYMTENYRTLYPGDFEPAQGQSASMTKTGKPTKPPTAGKSPFQNPFQGDADAAMMLGPMVEREKSTGVPMNAAVIILTILFISFVVMRK